LKNIRCDQRLAIGLMAMLIACYAGFVGWTYMEGFDKAAQGKRPLFTDFTSTYGAGLLVRQQPVKYLYHQESIIQAHREAGNAAYGGTLNERQKNAVGFAPFMYPPPFIAVVAPLGFFSYFGALIAWFGVTLIPYLAAMRSILERDRMAVWIALAAPPAFYNIMFGQTGFLSAGLLGLGIFHVRQRPWLAGMLIGLASVKPHLGLLIPFALLAGGHWRVFASASATVIAMIAASILAFDMETWFAFIGVTIFHSEGFQHGAFPWDILTSVLSVARLSGASLDAAWQIQVCATAIILGIVILVWWQGPRRPDGFELQAAVLFSAIPLAIPLIYLYDLPVLVIAIAWLMRDMKLRGYEDWEAGVIAAAMLGLLSAKALGGVPGMHISVLSIAALFFLSLFRFRRLMAAGMVRPYQEAEHQQQESGQEKSLA
jgi:alpha-1,2-mannosyltransferase